MITVSTPIFNEKQFLGAVSIDISLKYLQGVINEALDKSLGYAYVLDRSIVLLAFLNILGLKLEEHKIIWTNSGRLLTNELGSNYLIFPHLELLNKAISYQYMHTELEKNEHYWLSQQLIAGSDSLSVYEASSIARLIHDYSNLEEQQPKLAYSGFIEHDFIFKSRAFVSIFSMPVTQWQLILYLKLL